MRFELEEITPLKRRLKVILSHEKLETELRDRVRQVTRETVLPGFRPGKVPPAEILRRFGDEMREQIAVDEIGDSFRQIREEQGLRIVEVTSYPGAKRYESKQDLHYEIEFEIFPEIQIRDFSSISLTCPVAKIQEADVDACLEEEEQKRRAKFFERLQLERRVHAGDRVTVAVWPSALGHGSEQENEEGIIPPLADAREICICVDPDNSELEARILDETYGERHKTLIPLHFLGDAGGAGDPEDPYYVQIIKIEYPQRSEPGVEGVETVWSDGLDSPEAEEFNAKLVADRELLRLQVRDELEAFCRRENRFAKTKAVLDALEQSHEIEHVPEAMLRGELEAAIENGNIELTEPQARRLAELRTSRITDAKRSLLVHKIAELHDVRVNQQELSAALVARYGSELDDLDSEHPRVKRRLGLLEAEIRADRIADLVAAQATIQEHRVSLQEIQNLRHAEPAPAAET